MPIPSKQITAGLKNPITIADTSILSTDAECIVNAANKSPGFALDDWGGIAEVIKNAVQNGATGEHENQYSLFEKDWLTNGTGKLAEDGKPVTADLTGKARLVEGGKKFILKNTNGDLQGKKAIIHAVAPDDWKGRKADQDQLKNAYLEALNRANDAKIPSIAIPPLGIGVFKIPPEESAKCAAEAIKEFNNIHPDSTLKITMVARGMHSDQDIESWVDANNKASANDIFQLALRQHLAEKDSEDYKATTALLAKIKKQQSEAEQQSSPLDRLAASWPPPQIIAEGLEEIFKNDAEKKDDDPSKVFKGLKIAKEGKADVFKVKNEKKEELAIVSTNSISFPPIDGKFTDQQAELAIKCFEQLAAKNSATLDKPLLLNANNFEKEALESLIKKCQDKAPPIPIKLSVPGDKEGERKEVELFKKAPAPAVTTTDNPNDGVPRLPEPPTTPKAKF